MLASERRQFLTTTGDNIGEWSDIILWRHTAICYDNMHSEGAMLSLLSSLPETPVDGTEYNWWK